MVVYVNWMHLLEPVKNHKELSVHYLACWFEQMMLWLTGIYFIYFVLFKFDPYACDFLGVVICRFVLLTFRNKCKLTFKWFSRKVTNWMFKKIRSHLFRQHLHDTLTPLLRVLWRTALRLIFDTAIFCWNSRHSAPCVLANVTWGTVQGNSRREERASSSSRGERYHCKVVSLLTGLLCLVQLCMCVWGDSSNTLCSCSALLLFQLWQVTGYWMYWLLYIRWQFVTL